MKKSHIFAILNAVALLGTLVVNFIANALPLNNLTTGEISDQFAVLFKPAGYAFSIWGLIYIGLIVFDLYQLINANKKSNLIEQIGMWFMLSCLANAGWLFAWHYEVYPVTILLMLLLLFTLIRIYTNLKTKTGHVSIPEYWFVHQPFSLYLGWVSVATVANMTIYLNWLGWNGFGLSDMIWFILAGMLGIALSFYFAIYRRDYIFNLVLLWAYTAIAVNNAGNGDVSTVSWILSILALLPVILSVLNIRKMPGT